MAGLDIPVAGTVTVITPLFGNDTGFSSLFRILNSNAIELEGKPDTPVVVLIEIEISPLLSFRSERVVESNESVYLLEFLSTTNVTESTLLLLLIALSILLNVLYGTLTDSASPTGIISESSPAVSTLDIKSLTCEESRSFMDADPSGPAAGFTTAKLDH